MAACRLPRERARRVRRCQAASQRPIAIEVDAVGVCARACRRAVGVEIGNERQADAVGNLDEIVTEVIKQQIDEIGRIGLVALMDATDDRDPARPIAQLHAADSAPFDRVGEQHGGTHDNLCLSIRLRGNCWLRRRLCDWRRSDIGRRATVGRRGRFPRREDSDFRTRRGLHVRAVSTLRRFAAQRVLSGRGDRRSWGWCVRIGNWRGGGSGAHRATDAPCGNAQWDATQWKQAGRTQDRDQRQEIGYACSAQPFGAYHAASHRDSAAERLPMAAPATTVVVLVSTSMFRLIIAWLALASTIVKNDEPAGR